MLAFSEFGTGPEVILLHGLLGSRANMSMIAGSLAEFFHVITVDLRNHGDSFHDESMTYKDMVEDLIGFMNERDIKSASLVGHSMGGKCVMQTALSFPGRVKKIAVVDIAPREYTPDWEIYLESMLDLDLNQIQKRSDADALMAKSVTDRVYRQFLLQNLARTDENKFVWRSNVKALFNSKKDICAPVIGKAILTDALFVKGGNSPYVHKGDADSILYLFPNAEIKTISGAGHLVHFEARESFTAMLIDFLKDS